MNQMQCLRSAVYGISHQMMVEGGKLAVVGASQSQEVGVRYLAGVEQAGAVDALAVEQAHGQNSCPPSPRNTAINSAAAAGVPGELG